jgi:hypothetical protein
MGFIHSILNEVQSDSGTDLSLEATALEDVMLSRSLTLNRYRCRRENQKHNKE